MTNLNEYIDFLNNGKEGETLEEFTSALRPAVRAGLKWAGRKVGRGAGKGLDVLSGGPISKFVQQKVTRTYGKKGLAAGSARLIGDVAGFTIVTPPIIAAWRLYARRQNEELKKCSLISGGFSPMTGGSSEFERCKLKAQLIMAPQKIALLQRTRMSECPRNKDVIGCQQKINDNIENIRRKMEVWRDQLEKTKGVKEIEEVKINEDTENINEIAPLIAGAAMSVLGFIGFIIAQEAILKAVWASSRAIKSRYDNDLKRCGTFGSGYQFELCMLNARVRKETAELAVLNRVRGACAREKNPERCTKAISGKIKKATERVMKTRERIRIMKED